MRVQVFDDVIDERRSSGDRDAAMRSKSKARLTTNDAIRRARASREFNVFFYTVYPKFYRAPREDANERLSRRSTPSVDFDSTPLHILPPTASRRVYACFPVVPVAFVLSLPVVPVDIPVLMG